MRWHIQTAVVVACPNRNIYKNKTNTIDSISYTICSAVVPLTKKQARTTSAYRPCASNAAERRTNPAATLGLRHTPTPASITAKRIFPVSSHARDRNQYKEASPGLARMALPNLSGGGIRGGGVLTITNNECNNTSVRSSSHQRLTSYLNKNAMPEGGSIGRFFVNPGYVS